jgi:hypothetical protein
MTLLDGQNIAMIVLHKHPEIPNYIYSRELESLKKALNHSLLNRLHFDVLEAPFQDDSKDEEKIIFVKLSVPDNTLQNLWQRLGEIERRSSWVTKLLTDPILENVKIPRPYSDVYNDSPSFKAIIDSLDKDISYPWNKNEVIPVIECTSAYRTVPPPGFGYGLPPMG